MIEQKTTDKMNELLGGHCWEPMKEAAQKWLASIGTDDEDKEKEKLMPLLKNSIATTEEVIYLFSNDEMRAKFGDMGDVILSHAKDMKAQGEKYCDCPACTKAKEIYEELGGVLE